MINTTLGCIKSHENKVDKFQEKQRNKIIAKTYAIVRRPNWLTRSGPGTVSFATAVCAHKKPVMNTVGNLEMYKSRKESAADRMPYEAAQAQKLSANAKRMPSLSKRNPTTRDPKICTNEKKLWS